jgi:hypothetical protein
VGDLGAGLLDDAAADVHAELISWAARLRKIVNLDNCPADERDLLKVFPAYGHAQAQPA